MDVRDFPTCCAGVTEKVVRTATVPVLTVHAAETHPVQVRPDGGVSRPNRRYPRESWRCSRPARPRSGTRRTCRSHRRCLRQRRARGRADLRPADALLIGADSSSTAGEFRLGTENPVLWFGTPVSAAGTASVPPPLLLVRSLRAQIRGVGSGVDAWGSLAGGARPPPPTRNRDSRPEIARTVSYAHAARRATHCE
jgi:hypothetical protein